MTSKSNAAAGRNSVRMVLLLAAVVLVSSLTAPAQVRKDRELAKQLQSQADIAFTQKNYADAAEKYRQSIVLVPNNPAAHYWKAVSHYYLKQYDVSLIEFQAALTQGYKPLDVYRFRWLVYFENKDTASALADLSSGLLIDPRDLTMLKGVGDVYASKNQFTEALAAYQKALAVAPRDGDTSYNIARVQAALGNTNGQSAAAQDAISNGTQMMGDAYFLLADADRKLHDIPGAILAYQRAINVRPNFYEAYRGLADLYRSENRLSDAISIAREALKTFPNDGNLYTDLSWYYSLLDRPQDAVQAAKAGITLLPNQYMAYTNLCRAYNEVKSYDLAIGTCNSALKLNPGDGETYFYLGRAYNLQGKTAEATKFYALAVTGLVDYTGKNPDYSDGWYLLGNAYYADNQRDKAIEAYLKCLELSPKFAKGRYNLGIIYTRKKNKAAASEQYNSLLSLDPALAASLKSEIDKM